MSIYKPGTYKGRVVEYGINEAKSTGNPQLFVVFDVDFPDGVGRLTWYGHFTEKTREITFKALQNLGFTGKLLDLLEPSDSVIRVGVEASLVIEEEKNDRGTFCKIRWVNRVGGGGTAPQRADVATAKAKLLSMGLDAALAKHRALHPDPVMPDNDDTPF